MWIRTYNERDSLTFGFDIPRWVDMLLKVNQLYYQNLYDY